MDRAESEQTESTGCFLVFSSQFSDDDEKLFSSQDYLKSLSALNPSPPMEKQIRSPLRQRQINEDDSRSSVKERNAATTGRGASDSFDSTVTTIPSSQEEERENNTGDSAELPTKESSGIAAPKPRSMLSQDSVMPMVGSQEFDLDFSASLPASNSNTQGFNRGSEKVSPCYEICPEADDSPVKDTASQESASLLCHNNDDSTFIDQGFVDKGTSSTAVAFTRMRKLPVEAPCISVSSDSSVQNKSEDLFAGETFRNEIEPSSSSEKMPSDLHERAEPNKVIEMPDSDASHSDVSKKLTEKSKDSTSLSVDKEMQTDEVEEEKPANSSDTNKKTLVLERMWRGVSVLNVSSDGAHEVVSESMELLSCQIRSGANSIPTDSKSASDLMAPPAVLPQRQKSIDRCSIISSISRRSSCLNDISLSSAHFIPIDESSRIHSRRSELEIGKVLFLNNPSPEREVQPVAKSQDHVGSRCMPVAESTRICNTISSLEVSSIQALNNSSKSDSSSGSEKKGQNLPSQETRAIEQMEHDLAASRRMDQMEEAGCVADQSKDSPAKELPGLPTVTASLQAAVHNENGKVKVAAKKPWTEKEKGKDETIYETATETSNEDAFSISQASIKEVVTPQQSQKKSLIEEDEVFAEWNDGYYYPGRVICMLGPLKGIVKFDDGDKKQVSVKRMFACSLLPVGSEVLAEKSSSKFSELATVEKVDSCQHFVRFLDGSTAWIMRQQISIPLDQVNSIKRALAYLPESDALGITQTPSCSGISASSLGASGRKPLRKTPCSETKSRGASGDSGAFTMLSPSLPPLSYVAGEQQPTAAVPMSSNQKTPESQSAAVLPKLQKVLALWKDQHLYPGHIVGYSDSDTDASCEPGSTDKVTVEFVDGDKLVVPIGHILPTDLLLPGKTVMCPRSDDGWSELAEIVERTGDEFVVKFLTGDKDTQLSVPLCWMTMTFDQACDIQPSFRTPSRANFSLENLMLGKRRRGKKTFFSPEAPTSGRKVATPTSGRKVATPRSARRAPPLDGATRGTPASSSRGKRPKTAITPRSSGGKRKMGRGEEESATKRATVTPVSKRRLKNIMYSPKAPKARQELIFTDAPVMPRVADLFIDMNFVLTSIARTANTSSSSLSMEVEDHSYPFNREALMLQIQAGGGRVVEELYDLIARNIPCFLVSDSHQRTLKYLHALALGVPCISNLWIRDCCTKNSLLSSKSYLLPRGVNIETGSLIESSQVSQKPLERLKFLVLSSDEHFVMVWSSLLVSCCAVVLPKVPVSHLSDVDYAVTDSSIALSLQDKLEQSGVVLVSSEWVVQCVLQGIKISSRVHDRYRHDCE